jgi:hypothetical protein
MKLPQGFRAASIAAGLKSTGAFDRFDLDSESRPTLHGGCGFYFK